MRLRVVPILLGLLAACGAGRPVAEPSTTGGTTVGVNVIFEDGKDSPVAWWREGDEWMELDLTEGGTWFTVTRGAYEVASVCLHHIEVFRATPRELGTIELHGCGEVPKAQVTLEVTGLEPGLAAVATTEWNVVPVEAGAPGSMWLGHGVRDLAILEGTSRSETGDVDTARITMVRDIVVTGSTTLTVDARGAAATEHRDVTIEGALDWETVTVISGVDTEHGGRLVLSRDSQAPFRADLVPAALLRPQDHPYVIAHAVVKDAGDRWVRGDGATLVLPEPLNAPRGEPTATGYTLTWWYPTASWFTVDAYQSDCQVGMGDCGPPLTWNALVTAGASGAGAFATPPQPPLVHRWIDPDRDLDVQLSAYHGAIATRLGAPTTFATSGASSSGRITR